MIPFFGNSRRWPVALGVAGFVLLIAVQLLLTSRANTVTWDEDDHIYAGYRMWTHGDFGLNPEHPPLVKLLATLPLLPMQLKTPEVLDRPYRLQAVLGGKDFLFHNDADRIVRRAQRTAALLTLLLVVLVFLTAQEMFGTLAGFLALGLLAFDPTLIAHGALVTTDAAQACFLLASIYAFYRYIQAPNWNRLSLVGLAVGLALASKHSAVLIVPMLLVLAFSEVVRHRLQAQNSSRLLPDLLRMAGALAAVGVIAFTVLWASYGFRYAARGEGLQLNPTMAAQLAKVPSAAEAQVLSACARLHLLPESYLYGFAHVLASAKQFNSYVFGTPYPHAVWFYFPAALLVKSTLTFLILLIAATAVIASGRLRKGREMLFLLVPALLYLFFSMTGGMNIGVRHILPVYLFLTIVIAGAMASLIERERRWLYPVLLLLVFQAVSVTRAFPDTMAYANEAFGGPQNVWKYLSDSSADWGQQLHAVKRYTDQRQLRQCWFVYFGYGVIDYSYYGIPCKPLPTADSLWLGALSDAPPQVDGPVLISAADLTGFEFGPGALNPYEQFKQLQPTAVIDSSVFVYEGHFAIPLAASIAHGQKAGILLAQKQPAAALLEAQQAVLLAPGSASAQATLGLVLDALGRRAEARPSYEAALRLARSVEPAFQQSMLPALEARLAAKD